MPKAVAAILAGGESRRMGRAKATLELAGRPLVSYPLAAAAAADLEPIVVAKPGSELPHLRCPVVRDSHARSHPLAGIVAALRASRGLPVVAVGCDMPLVSAELLRWLVALDAPLAVPRLAGRLQPLLARYTPALAEPLEQALEREAPIHTAVVELGPRVVSERELAHFGDPAVLCLNVNTPADLARAELLLRSER